MLSTDDIRSGSTYKFTSEGYRRMSRVPGGDAYQIGTPVIVTRTSPVLVWFRFKNGVEHTLFINEFRRYVEVPDDAADILERLIQKVRGKSQ